MNTTVNRIIISRTNSSFNIFIIAEYYILTYRQKKSSDLCLHNKNNKTDNIYFRNGGPWFDIINEIFYDIDLPNKKTKNIIKQLIHSRKKWKCIVPIIKNLYIEIMKTNWIIEIECYQDDLYYNSKSLLYISERGLYDDFINILSHMKLQKVILEIIFEYYVTINDEIVYCNCGNITHNSCIR